MKKKTTTKKKCGKMQTMTFGGFRLSQDDMSKLWTKMPESEKSTIKKSLRRYKKMSKY